MNAESPQDLVRNWIKIPVEKFNTLTTTLYQLQLFAEFT